MPKFDEDLFFSIKNFFEDCFEKGIIRRNVLRKDMSLKKKYLDGDRISDEDKVLSEFKFLILKRNNLHLKNLLNKKI